ncbi:MAG: hypothetical protein AABO41_05800 [Acidobacteriota bacterium]
MVIREMRLLLLLAIVFIFPYERPFQSTAQAQTQGQRFGPSQSETPDRAEASALATMKQIISAQERFRAGVGSGSYGTIKELADAGLVSFLDGRHPVKDGYFFEALGKVTKTGFEVVALPLDFLETGESKHGVLVAFASGVLILTTQAWVAQSKIRYTADNENSAIGSVKTLAVAEATYQSTRGKGVFFGTLSQLVDDGAIDRTLGTGIRNGYQFTVVLSTDRKMFQVFATPIQYGVTGSRSFYTSESYVVCSADRQGKRATSVDPPIE